MDVLDRLGGEHLAVFVGLAEFIVEHLHHHRRDLFQIHVSQRRLDVLIDGCAIPLESGILLVTGVFLDP